MSNNGPRILELFCGIGGTAVALGKQADVVAAIDINAKALELYRRNSPHPITIRTIESIPIEQLKSWQADLWWLSPPCQPFTSRGRMRDVDDPRCAALVHLAEAISEVRPTYVGLENVRGFACSRAHELLRQTLDRGGYHVQETVLCPTELGIPNRRPRFYLLASLVEVPNWPPAARAGREYAFSIGDILDDAPDPRLNVPEAKVQAYSGAIHIVDADDARATTSCFTSAYGRSMTSSGSFLRTRSGVRRFSPREILRLLGFPSDYELPMDVEPADLWPLVGNSLSIAAVRYALGPVLGSTVAPRTIMSSGARQKPEFMPD